MTRKQISGATALLGAWLGILAAPAFAAPPAATASGEAAEEPTPAARNEGDQALQSEQQEILYALGLALSHTLDRMNIQQAELPYLIEGLEDGVLGRPPQLSLEEYAARVEELASARLASSGEREKARAEQFLARMAAEPGAVRTESGIVLVTEREGTGPSPTPADTVRVNYEGTLADGTVFDSSKERGKPVTLPLDEVIPCWSEALLRMKVGGRARIVCPPELAYGSEGGPGIPPNSVLVFEIHLLGIGDTPTAAPGRYGDPLLQQVASLR